MVVAISIDLAVLIDCINKSVNQIINYKDNKSNAVAL